MNEIRRLVTRERVSAVAAIPDADAIEAVAVRGWTVVAKKGEFTAGDECVYVEIDAALPLDDERFAFLAPRGTKTLGDGKRVHVLKTALLRGVYSQGLVLPIGQFPEVIAASASEDLAALLGIEKYEPPIPAQMVGELAGQWRAPTGPSGWYRWPYRRTTSHCRPRSKRQLLRSRRSPHSSTPVVPPRASCGRGFRVSRSTRSTGASRSRSSRTDTCSSTAEVDSARPLPESRQRLEPFQ